MRGTDSTRYVPHSTDIPGPNRACIGPIPAPPSTDLSSSLRRPRDDTRATYRPHQVRSKLPRSFPRRGDGRTIHRSRTAAGRGGEMGRSSRWGRARRVPAVRHARDTTPPGTAGVLTFSVAVNQANTQRSHTPSSSRKHSPPTSPSSVRRSSSMQ